MTALSWLMRGFIIAVVLLPAMLSGCNAGSPVKYFPIQNQVFEVYPAAAFHGVLVLEDGILRVKTKDLDVYYTILPVWPFGYRYRVEGAMIIVYDDRGYLAARTGDIITIGGGEISTETVERLAAPPVPEGVKGSFWMAAPGIDNETLELEEARERLGLPEPSSTTPPAN
jgi:hypothetical protein